MSGYGVACLQGKVGNGGVLGYNLGSSEKGSDVKQTLYIKFINPRDAELFSPTYFIGNDIQTHCPKCGNILYLPIEIDTEKKIEINKPMGEIFRPFPREMPHYVTRDEEPKISIGFQWSKIRISQETKRYLMNKHAGGGLAMIDDNGWIELQVDGISQEPVDCEVCNQPKTEEVDPCRPYFDIVEPQNEPINLTTYLYQTGNSGDD